MKEALIEIKSNSIIALVNQLKLLLVHHLIFSTELNLKLKLKVN